MSIPQYESGIADFRCDVFVTDRDNVNRTPLGDALISVQPDWDIDRSGSKGRVQIETQAAALQPGMWIAPYVTITPETGEIVTQQVGHFRLGKAGVRFDGLRGLDGKASRLQHANGADIVNDIAAVHLSETFATPVNGNVMQDVRALVKMATCGRMGANLLANGGFESGLAGWDTSWQTGGTRTTSTVYPFTNAPNGLNALTTEFASTAIAGDRRIPAAAGNRVVIPAGTQYLYVSGFARRTRSEIRNRISIEFRDNAGAIGPQSFIGSMAHIPALQWGRFFEVIDVPAGALYLIVGLENHLESTVGAAAYSYWDDIRVGVCTSQPLPDRQVALPESTASAATRIQTTVGKSIGYHAINADRLNAVGHHALYTDLAGRLTSQPMRTLAHAQPVRSYGRGDVRLVGVIEIPASDGNVPNHFTAIKEDYEDAAKSMWAHAYNNSTSDPFSIPNQGGRVVSADPIMVPDAVSEAALLAIAEAARDRVAIQEELTIQVLPDPTLQVHDVIEITDPDMPEARGKWAIESLAPGMTPERPLVTIGARRAIGMGG